MMPVQELSASPHKVGKHAEGTLGSCEGVWDPGRSPGQARVWPHPHLTAARKRTPPHSSCPCSHSGCNNAQ